MNKRSWEIRSEFTLNDRIDHDALDEKYETRLTPNRNSINYFPRPSFREMTPIEKVDYERHIPFEDARR